jgi:TRAP transporter 4TM/12TM fusion protein
LSDRPALQASIDEEHGSREAGRLETPRFSQPDGVARFLVRLIAIALSLFQLYTAAFGVYEQFQQRATHLAFGLALIALTYRVDPRTTRVEPLDWLFGIVAVLSAIQVLLDYKALMNRIAYVDPVPAATLAAAIGLTAVTLEACRRTIGVGLALVCLAFIAYALLGHLVPGDFGHPGVAFTDLMETFYLSGEGIFGIPIGVSATYVYVFVLFGSFIMRIGLMQLFADLALALAGASHGGPAKVAVICSALFGTISGSGIANAITTGSFTVPLMKRVGYSPHFAAGVESAASMGGNIMPPIMGAAAFIMADFLGVPYVEVAIAATIPALLYFLGIGTMVHFEARARGMPRLPRDQLPSAWAALRARGHLLLPVVALIWFLVAGWSVMFAGVAATLSAIPVSYLRRETRLTLPRLIDALEASAITSLPVIAACAVVGIIIGVIAQTGLGVKMASAILSFAGGSLFLTLALAMAASLILGLGLPTTPTYIITAALTAPALVKFGVPPLAAHLFVFYYGILADITPPTAIAPYAVAGIANADPNKTCWAACGVALSGFIVPFVFCYEPVMLDPLLRLKGSTLIGFASVVASALLGIVLLSGALIGWLRCRATLFERAVMLLGGVCLIVPGAVTDAAGIAAAALVAALQTLRLRRQPLPESSSRSSP